MTFKPPFPNDAVPGYGAEWLRYTAEVSGLQEGVLGASDLKVTAAAAGGMRVDVAAGSAFVKGDSGSPGTGVSQGLFLAVNDASIPNAVTLPASNGSNPRVDQIVLRVRDTSDLGTGGDDLALLYLSGAATAGATLDNRNGAAALPADHVRLADVLVPASSTVVSVNNIRDRRPWGRGAFFKTSNPGVLNQGNWPSGWASTVSNLYVDLECSGSPVRVAWHFGRVALPNPPTYNLFLRIAMDGSPGPSAKTAAPYQQVEFTAQAVYPGAFSLEEIFTPSPGRHRFAVQVYSDNAAAPSSIDGTHTFTAEEISRTSQGN
jgi:hypothetical protein